MVAKSQMLELEVASEEEMKEQPFFNVDGGSCIDLALASFVHTLQLKIMSRPSHII